VPFHRGAWLRVYGVPVHAWSEDCFKLCVLDCGRYLRTDGCTLNRERFDYARVLVATSSLDIVNVTDSILIDGVEVNIKMCEEWGFNLGDDTCLYDVEEGSNSSNDDGHTDLPRDPDAVNNVDTLVDNLVNELIADENDIFSHHSEAATAEHVSSEPVTGRGVPGHSPGAASGSVDRLKRIPVIRQIVSAGDAVVDDRPKARKRSIRQSSCPPGGIRSISSSGPWSMEWLQSRNLGEVTSAPRVTPTSVEVDDGQCRKKVGGVLNHNVHCLKKVARLSGSDRLEVLKMIRKQERKQQRELCLQHAMEGVPSGFLAGTTSSSSANND